MHIYVIKVYMYTKMATEMFSGLITNRKTDLILVNSPLRDYDERPKDGYEVLPPLGLGYIATVVNHSGYNVGVLDAEHQGIGSKRLSELVNASDTRFVGVNVLTPTKNEALKLASSLNHDTKLIIGGPHATARPVETLMEFNSYHKNTILISNEGELSTADLLNGQPIETIPNAWWIDANGQVRSNKTRILNDLDSIPILKREFLINDPSIDRKTGKVEARVLTSRGCPFNCTFCAGAREVNPVNAIARARNPEKIAEEVKSLVIDNGCSSIRFVDDLFISSEARVRSVLKAIEDAGVKSLQWDATGRANILSKFSPELLDFLKEHGAHEIAIGIESGSERLRHRINKNVTEQQIETSISALTSRGIHIKGYFIIGLPTETKIETMETLNMARRLTVSSDKLFRASVFVFRPYPGTKEWADLVRLGYKETDLLSMHASGTGERSKHEVLTTLKFGEYEPEELSKLLTDYNNRQAEYYKTY